MDTLETRSMGGFMSLHSNNKGNDIVTTVVEIHFNYSYAIILFGKQ